MKPKNVFFLYHSTVGRSILYWHLYCRYTLNTTSIWKRHNSLSLHTENVGLTQKFFLYTLYYVRISQLHGGQMIEKERNPLTNSINRKEWDNRGTWGFIWLFGCQRTVSPVFYMFLSWPKQWWWFLTHLKSLLTNEAVLQNGSAFWMQWLWLF